jgi:hypothetical protein
MLITATADERLYLTLLYKNLFRVSQLARHKPFFKMHNAQFTGTLRSAFLCKIEKRDIHNTERGFLSSC